ncbi:NAD(P)H-quinone oxidoreductase [Aquaspirillum sp. LM1]|uniref:NAD(P)H-quinone oxidoreductase n=1 Tax=Aquaspirillum sp. LM1 TaxID=1938604 RepID=UPI000983E42D|nr:NAD(P)H-quinone oxidoreductase [Aquaspirillum sp. LM1]AQR64616.1 NAD(P)H-quinone oxidoreductase [Aquaspirillum sp. LM1]
MYAILQNAPGGSDSLYWGEAALPEPGPGQLRVRVRACGVNRADIVQREGRYPPPADASPILGLELAGEVDALGENVSGWALGDAVLALVPGGAYAEYALVNADEALPKPASWSWAQAASVPEAWLTAWLNLIEVGQLHAGQTVLIHAGASGVGAAAIQLARWRGATVVATCGSADKAAFCQRLGAHQVVNYHEAAFADTVRALGRADLVLDCVGGSYLDAHLSCLKTDGKLVLIGVMGGAQAMLNLGLLLVKRISLIGSTLRSQPLAHRAALARQLQQQLPLWDAGLFQWTLDRTFALPDAAQAHAWLEGNHNQGKVVLLVP